jgi:hypothetical protein
MPIVKDHQPLVNWQLTDIIYVIINIKVDGKRLKAVRHNLANKNAPRLGARLKSPFFEL